MQKCNLHLKLKKQIKTQEKCLLSFFSVVLYNGFAIFKKNVFVHFRGFSAFSKVFHISTYQKRCLHKSVNI